MRVKGAASFTLTRQTNGFWAITEPALMPADPSLVKAFMTNFFEMTIENFAKDVPTDADLKQFGLEPPQISYALFTLRTNAAGVATNSLLTQVDFGITGADGMMYARRTDETPVYQTPDISYLLPMAAWQLRDRRIYDFAPTNVVAIIFTGGGKTNRFARGPQGWAGGDLVSNAARDEALFRLGKLQARNWLAKGTRRWTTFGFQKDGLMIEVELTPGSLAMPAPILFGKQGVRNNIYGATVLPGDVEPTVFEFPGELYEMLLNAFGGQ